MEIYIPLDKILPNPEQPRREFDQTELESLGASLKTIQLQNILVEPANNGYYMLIDGERRTRAARLANLPTLRATVLRQTTQPIKTMDRLLMALVANVQRTDLNPIEEGQAYAEMQAAGLSISEITRRTGIHHKRITDRLTWTKLSQEIQQLAASKQLPTDHRIAQAILTLPESVRLPFAQKMASRPGLTIDAICKAAARFADSLPTPSGEGQAVVLDRRGEGRSPAIRTVTGRESSNTYNALSAVKKLPPWEQFRDAVIQTCQACALYEYASQSTCRDCPLVNHVDRLTASE